MAEGGGRFGSAISQLGKLPEAIYLPAGGEVDSMGVLASVRVLDRFEKPRELATQVAK